MVQLFRIMKKKRRGDTGCRLFPALVVKKRGYLDVGLIRTDAPEGTRFRVLRIRPL